MIAKQLILCRAIAFLAIFVAFPAFADYGYAAVSFECKEKIDSYELRLFILWNENLKRFLNRHPSGVATRGALHTKIFMSDDNSYSRSCQTPLRLIKATIARKSNTRNYMLEVKEGNQVVALKMIDYVWAASGEQYFLKSHQKGVWEECVGADEDSIIHPVACGSVTRSETTDSDDVDAIRKK